MRFVVRASNTIYPVGYDILRGKSALLVTSHRHPYSAKPKVSFAADFEVIGCRDRYF